MCESTSAFSMKEGKMNNILMNKDMNEHVIFGDFQL